MSLSAAQLDPVVVQALGDSGADCVTRVLLSRALYLAAAGAQNTAAGMLSGLVVTLDVELDTLSAGEAAQLREGTRGLLLAVERIVAALDGADDRQVVAVLTGVGQGLLQRGCELLAKKHGGEMVSP